MACGGGSDATTPSPSHTSTPTTLPTPSATPPLAPTPTPGPYLYAVKDGDVLSAIADLFGVTVDALVEANELPDETSIAVGQLLIIPGVTATPRPSPGPTSTSTDNLLGMHLIMPIAGACLTPEDDQMPNAPREYRSGIHEGVDFFTSFACVDVPKGLPVLAVADGAIIRADHDYRALTQAQIEQLEARVGGAGLHERWHAGQVPRAPGLDRPRERIVTRYCHLDGVPKNIQVGVAA